MTLLHVTNAPEPVYISTKNCFLVSNDTVAFLHAVWISFLPVDHCLPLSRSSRALHKRLGFHFLRQGTSTLGVQAESADPCTRK